MLFGNHPNIDVREYQPQRTSNSFLAYQSVLRNASSVLPLIRGGRILQLSNRSVLDNFRTGECLHSDYQRICY